MAGIRLINLKEEDGGGTRVYDNISEFFDVDKYLIDSHKLIYHPDRVLALKNAGRDWEKHKFLKPIYAEISTSGACNHRCTFCSVDYIGYKNNFISYETLENFFKCGEKLGLKSVMFAGDGEPLLNPEIAKIVNRASYHNIDTAFTTNGVHLSEKMVRECIHNISWIKVSINAGNEQQYANIHRTKGSDFHKVWKNLRFISDYKKANRNINTTLGSQSLLLPDNVGSLDELAKRSIENGLDYMVIKPYVHNIYMLQPGYKDIDYTQKQYLETISRLKQNYDSDTFKIISRENALSKLVGETERYSKCWSTPALWFYISGDGTVYTCGAHVGNENFKLGNINNENIDDIWKSDKRKNCLNYVQDELDLNDCRRTCRMDEVNSFLHKVMDDQPDHINFI